MVVQNGDRVRTNQAWLAKRGRRPLTGTIITNGRLHMASTERVQWDGVHDPQTVNRRYLELIDEAPAREATCNGPN